MVESSLHFRADPQLPLAVPFQAPRTWTRTWKTEMIIASMREGGSHYDDKRSMGCSHPPARICDTLTEYAQTLARMLAGRVATYDLRQSRECPRPSRLAGDADTPSGVHCLHLLAKEARSEIVSRSSSIIVASRWTRRQLRLRHPTTLIILLKH